jgi:hypothetical protein
LRRPVNKLLRNLYQSNVSVLTLSVSYAAFSLYSRGASGNKFHSINNGASYTYLFSFIFKSRYNRNLTHEYKLSLLIKRTQNSSFFFVLKIKKKLKSIYIQLSKFKNKKLKLSVCFKNLKWLTRQDNFLFFLRTS